MRGYNTHFVIGAVLITILMIFSNVSIIIANENETFDKNENINLLTEKTVQSLIKEDLNQISNPTIEFEYPQTGFLYNRNTAGRSSPLLSLIGYAFYIGGNLEAGVQTNGNVDEVLFTLSDKEGEVTDWVDNEGNAGFFNCRFFSVYDLIGVYTITADGYYQDEVVCSTSISNVIFLKMGSGSNEDPVAIIDFEKVVWEGQEVQFDGSESYDTDGIIEEYLWDFGDGTYSDEMSPTHAYDEPGKYDIFLHVEDNNGGKGVEHGEITVLDYDFGTWIVTNYEGQTDAVKLGLGIEELKWMLYYGGGSKTYHLSLEDEDDTEIHLHFGKTKIEGINSIVTNFDIKVDGNTDLSNEFEIGLEFRFPYSILFTENPQGDEYFAGRVAYHYEGDIPGKSGPHDVKCNFYFGKNSLQDPGILRMKIDPYPYGVVDLIPLTYEASYLTVDENGVEKFNKQLAVEFDPAAELTITSIPSQGKINYYFGDETAGQKTTIRFTSTGTLFSDIVQEFILDPLPSFMKFDLTVFGERSFHYEADRSYDITYCVSSIQNGEIVKLDLDDLPRTIDLSWGLNVNLIGLSASGFIDLDMSSNLGNAKLYLQGSSDPFIDMDNFPQNLRVEGSINVKSLSGYIQADKYSGGQTTVTVPISFDKWDIDATLIVNDGHAKAEFNLPDSNSNHVKFGLDTDGDPFLGWQFKLTDTTTSQEVIEFNVDGIATKDLLIQWNNNGGQIENFEISGKVTKFINLELSVNYQTAALDVSGTWQLREGGEFLLELNKPVEVTFVDMESESFKLYGYISLYGNRKIKITWELTEGYGSDGWFQIYTFGQPIGNEFHLDFEYAPNADSNYQYGFKMDGYDFIEITRTIMWQTTDRIIPRIWILGDNPLPGDWTIQVLWKGEWYPVPFDD